MDANYPNKNKNKNISRDSANTSSVDNTISDNDITRPKSQRIFAMIAVILLVCMYLITLISAFTTSDATRGLFMASVGASIVLPGLLWLHIRIWEVSTNRDRKNFEKDMKKISDNDTSDNHKSD